MAGLGKYCMGGYGQIGVYRVKYPLQTMCKITVQRRQMRILGLVCKGYNFSRLIIRQEF